MVKGAFMPSYSGDELFGILRPLPQRIKRGAYSIPVVPKAEIDLKNLGNGIFLQGFKNCTAKDVHCENKIVHFFLNDRELDRIYRKPLKHVPTLVKYNAVRTPDFSRFKERDEFGIINATYKNRYVGALWSSYGIKVIPTIGWAGEDSFPICFEGVEQGSTVSISTLGIHSDRECVDAFLTGFKQRKERIRPSKIICLGDFVDGMDTENVFFVPYRESFGRQFKNGWQLRLFDEKGKVQ